MKAITIWQPWASLIAYEAKPYEFRRWELRPGQFNQRIAVHAGKRPAQRGEIQDLIYKLEHEDGAGTALKAEIALPLLQRALTQPGALPHSAVVCTAFLGRARKATSLFSSQVADSDRFEQHVWAWPLTNIERLEPPEPASGKQRFWNWTPPALAGRQVGAA